MQRRDSKERVGVLETALVFEKIYKWVFREQPIVDVGIDSLVELCEDGNPTGDFLALQIKSGEGNFHKSDQNYTYYISNTHYYYWINIDFPVLLIAYLPDGDTILWQEISRKTVKKTSQRWKVDLPFSQKLDLDSYQLIWDLVQSKNDKEFRPKGEDKASSMERIADIEKVNLATDSMELISIYIQKLGINLRASGDRLEVLNQIQNEYERAQEARLIKSYIDGALTDFSVRLVNETRVFAVDIIESFFGYKEQVRIFKNKGIPAYSIILSGLAEKLVSVIKTFETANEANLMMDRELSLLLKNNPLKIEKGKMAKKAIRILINEFMVARDLWEQLLEELKN